MSNEAFYGLILLVVMVLALAVGIALVNWILTREKGPSPERPERAARRQGPAA